MLQEIRELGFTHVEISHGLKFSKWPGVKEAVKHGVVAVSSLHNFCPQPVETMSSSPNCYQFSDERLSQRMTAVRHTILTIENAAMLGAKAVVLHLGWAGPRGASDKVETSIRDHGCFSRATAQAKIRALETRNKASREVMGRVRECLEKIVPVATEHGIKLGLECRESFEEFPHRLEMDELLRDFPSETVGYWHDVGHAARQHYLTWDDHEAMLTRWGGRLIGCHVQDFSAPDEDHLPLEEGELDWPKLLRQFPQDYLAVLEINPQTSREQVIRSQELWNSYGKELG